MALVRRRITEAVPELGRLTRRVARPPAGPPPRIAILGAGAGGLCMGARLKQAGIDSFTIYEKSDGVGGTWRHNTYPGCACDAPSHFYSFSFAPWSEWDRLFAAQPQILEYFEWVADQFGLRSHLRTNCAVVDARLDQDDGVWRLRTEHGDDIEADIVVSGLGQLDVPFVPDFAGRDTFVGTAFHSARWNHDHDLAGEQVAVVGSAASAVQFVGQIAKTVEHLTVFQRSPNYVNPKPDIVYSDTVKRLFRRVGLLRRAHRAQIWWFLERNWWAFKPGTKRALKMEAAFHDYLASQVADVELRAKLTPDYPIGCKRILIQNDYLSTIASDGVTLVTEPIERVTTDGITTADGTHRRFDTIIYATGFETTSFLKDLEVVGRKCESIHDVWRQGAEAYLGLAVPGFPNFFLLYGPNTNLGHNSIIFMIECQVRYIMRVIDAWRTEGQPLLDVSSSAMERYEQEIERAMRDMVWATGCSSWYKNDAGKVTNNWPRTTTGYWLRTRRDDLSAFERLSPART